VARIASQYYPTKEEVTDQILRRTRIGGDLAGHTINVAVGSENWLRAKALAGVVAHAFANNKIGLTQYSPLTATGDKLLELAEQFGVEPRSGAQATGTATARCSGTVIIPDGYLCTAPNGEKYEVIGPETITTTGSVTLRAVNAGTAGNQSAGTVLTWDSASFGFLQRTLTTGGGLSGGTEDDTEEEVRQRLLLKLKSPPLAGSWAHIQLLALDASSSVASAYVYPAVRGPGTIDVCILGEDGAVLNDTICDEVAAYISGEISEHVSLNVTSTVDEEVDAVFALRLPSASSSTGGGWTDAAPWPPEPVRVTTDAGTVLTTSLAFGANDPVVGNTVYIHDGSTLLGPFAIDTVADAGGFVRITLNTDPTGDVTDCYISPACESLSDYVDTLTAAFDALGPGEKSASPYILPRGRRRPTTDSSDYARAGHRIEASIHDAHDEVIECRLVAVYTTETTTEHADPSVPAAAGDPPRRLRLARLGFTYEGS
jgi:uncharacterized phage protein gp47/JayE